jgi:hypothetical protein
MHVVEISAIPHATPDFCHYYLWNDTTGCPYPCHTHPTHTSLLNVFIQIYTDKRILKNKNIKKTFTADSKSVCLGIEHTCGTCDQILFPVGMLLSEICGLVSMGRPLWREDGSGNCSVITQWSESLRTGNHTLLSHLRLLQPGGPGSHIYIPQEQSGPVIPPGTGFPLPRLLWLASDGLQGYGGGILSSPNTEGQVPVYISLRNRMVKSKVKVTLWPTVS